VSTLSSIVKLVDFISETASLQLLNEVGSSVQSCDVQDVIVKSNRTSIDIFFSLFQIFISLLYIAIVEYRNRVFNYISF